MLKKIGILGGSFDPVHCAHIALAQTCAKHLALDEIHVIPAGQPWQKTALRASAEQRLAMLELALHGLSHSACRYVLDTRELRRSGPSYTIDTLQELRRALGENVVFVLLLGADQWLGLPTWHRWQEILQYAHIAIVTRPGFDLATMRPELRTIYEQRISTLEQLEKKTSGQVYSIEDLSLNISATQIRAALEQGIAAQNALPASVLDYIHTHHLYRN